MEHRIKDLLRQFREVLEGPAWIDENFRKKIDGISEDQAFQRPLPELHSVAELVSHLVVWRREVMQRLKGMERTLRESSPENWRGNEELRPQGWKHLRSDLYRSQEELEELLKSRPDSFLEGKYTEDHTYGHLVEGLLHHDLYHLGQLGITVKLLKNGGKR